MTDDHDMPRSPSSSTQRRHGAEEEEHELEKVFPTGASGQDSSLRPPIYAVIPEEVVSAAPGTFTAYLESIFTEDRVLEEALDNIFTPEASQQHPSSHTMRTLVPSGAMHSRVFDPASFLEEVFDAFSEIDEVIQEFSEDRDASSYRPSPPRAIVPDRAILDPETLTLAIEQARTESAKLELLFRQARLVLRRLDDYRLARQSPRSLVRRMRRANDLACLQYLVEFLQAIHIAAHSLERLEIPRFHIREYLTQLYLMEDWDAMEELVNRLEDSVMRYSEQHAAGSTARGR